MRLSREEYYIEVLKLTALRSTCLRKQVGAILVKDKRIISTGYAGSLPGKPHCIDVGCDIGANGGCIATIHAETNCIMWAVRNNVMGMVGSTLYTSLSPCLDCAKLIILAGIQAVIYLKRYRDQNPIDLLRDNGVICELYTTEEVS